MRPPVPIRPRIFDVPCRYCGIPIEFYRQACQDCILQVVIPQAQKEAKAKKLLEAKK